MPNTHSTQPLLNAGKTDICDLIALKDDIIQTLGNQAILSEIASNSYIHKNGFVKLVYETIEDTVCRLHVYPLGASADKNIHDHRWDFSSTTICGALPMSLFDVGEEGSEMFHTYSKTPNGHLIELKDSCSVQLISEVCFTPLQRYVMPSQLFHRIEEVKELTITYVETYPAKTEFCHLISSEDRSGSETIQPEPLTIDQTRQALALVALKIMELI
jgi:hypothetical protein